MKIRELRDKTEKELRDLLKNKRAEALDLSFRIAGGRVKNVKGLREAKKDIARILTLLHQYGAEKTK